MFKWDTLRQINKKDQNIKKYSDFALNLLPKHREIPILSQFICQ